MNRAGEALTNVGTFLLSLLLAVFIWISASQTQDPARTRFIEVPLGFVGIPTNATLVSPDTRQTVQIRLEGPDSILQAMTPEDFTATADLSDVPSGQLTTVEVVVASRNPAARISFITPEQIDVQLEQQVTREVPVELDLRGTVARGHEQDEPLLDPPFIQVSGPESRVNQLEFALVTTFLNNTAETLVESAQPIFYDQSGRVASVTGLVQSTNEVTVTIPVVESAGFADKLVTVEWTGEPAPGYRLLSVTADPPSVLVEGRPAQVNQLTSVKTEPIDINGLTQSYQQTAVLALPEGISVDLEQPVTVNIEVEPILTTSTFNRVPTLRGLAQAYDATFEPAQVRVILFGPLPALDALTENDIRVTLNLLGLETGVYSVEPDVDVPDQDIEIRLVQPATVTVTIVPAEADAGADTEAATAAVATVATAAPPTTTRAGATAAQLPALCYLSPAGAAYGGLADICSRRHEPR
jgi:YbbR domain-containing protein